ncbi:hypothetical protein UFOVP151_18 [uncultured Caudovirales phage]|uniref:Uncharacterized protein n=1 Tax=uncultured Caudovirales phage TaxID=2100421 RepID=A0A6J7WBF9_9CAUD|nr:hypothetical protein UFOVP151_18 [uncultured Caudovirales phage]
MSLEATIQENTNAIRDLIKTLAAGVPTTAAQVEAVVQQAKPKAVAAEVKTVAAASQEPQTQTAAASSKPSSSATPESKEFTYQEAAAAVLELSKAKGRNAALAVLTGFGAANLKEVKPEQYGAVMAAATEALGA